MLLKNISRLEFIIPLGLTIFSCAYLIECTKLNFGSFNFPEDGFFPTLNGILIFLLSSYLLVFNFLQYYKSPVNSTTPSISNRGEMANLCYLILVLFGYLVLLQAFGFIVSTILLLISSAKIMRVNWKDAIFLAIVTTAISYVIFVMWLRIPFPSMYELFA
jgi:putative tricarboxylic transport membrane protein